MIVAVVGCAVAGVAVVAAVVTYYRVRRARKALERLEARFPECRKTRPAPCVLDTLRKIVT